tara:strand:+ start:13 stop:237 length:225 start_codon:yes stop_codon:yes gene_type:complete
MSIKELEQEVEVIFDDLPQEVQEYINYLQDKNTAYFNAILKTKVRIYNKELTEAENELFKIIFEGINVQGYEQE